MTDIGRLLEQQADWQKTRSRLSWPEKIRMAEVMRETLRRFRSSRAESQGPRDKEADDRERPETSVRKDKLSTKSKNRSHISSLSGVGVGVCAALGLKIVVNSSEVAKPV